MGGTVCFMCLFSFRPSARISALKLLDECQWNLARCGELSTLWTVRRIYFRFASVNFTHSLKQTTEILPQRKLGSLRYLECRLQGSLCLYLNYKFPYNTFGVLHQYVCVIKSLRQYNLGGWSVGVTDGSDLWSTPLRWPQVVWNTYELLWRSVQEFK
jgi:hypothetical protein